MLQQGSTVPSQADITQYQGIKNQRGLGDFVPSGSFLLSSQDVKVVLSATCTKINGQGVPSTLDVSQFPLNEVWVENVDGVLTAHTVPAFNDTNMAQLSGSPVTQMAIRYGDVLNAIQATNGTLNLPQHGGDSGAATSFTLDAGDTIVEVSGYTGTWFGWNCVLQLTLKTRAGKTYGSYGSMANATSKMPFSCAAGPGQALLAFYGTTVTVPLAGGARPRSSRVWVWGSPRN